MRPRICPKKRSVKLLSATWRTNYRARRRAGASVKTSQKYPPDITLPVPEASGTGASSSGSVLRAVSPAPGPGLILVRAPAIVLSRVIAVRAQHSESWREALPSQPVVEIIGGPRGPAVAGVAGAVDVVDDEPAFVADPTAARASTAGAAVGREHLMSDAAVVGPQPIEPGAPAHIGCGQAGPPDLVFIVCCRPERRRGRPRSSASASVLPS